MFYSLKSGMLSQREIVDSPSWLLFAYKHSSLLILSRTFISEGTSGSSFVAIWMGISLRLKFWAWFFLIFTPEDLYLNYKLICSDRVPLGGSRGTRSLKLKVDSFVKVGFVLDRISLLELRLVGLLYSTYPDPLFNANDSFSFNGGTEGANDYWEAWAGIN